MRGTSDCCHYDEGYDDGYEKGIKEALIAARALQEKGEPINPDIDLRKVEEVVHNEQRKTSRQVLRYREALAR